MKPERLQSWRQRRAAEARGFSLVELLVSVVIGLVLTLILTTMIARQEGSRRTLTNGSDLTTSSAYLSYILDREIRSAGSGFNQGWNSLVGCPLTAARSDAQILPRASAFPAPFSTLPQAPILAPVLIHAGAGTGGSDVIAVAAGASGLGETMLTVLPSSAAAGQVSLKTTMGLRGGDLMLLAEVSPADGFNRCMLQQVAANFVGGTTQQVNFGGSYATDNIGSMALVTFATAAPTTIAAAIGNTTGNTPRFQFFGLGANNTLFSYDLLNLDGLDTPQPVAEGVVGLRALYGIANAAGAFAGWVAPTGAFDIATLTNGTPASQQTLKTIVAVRVGLIMRSDLVERDTVNKTQINLFDSLPGNFTFTYNVPAGQERQRFRAVEFTVPLRNPLL